MNYTVGKTGRVLVLRLEHGEAIYTAIESVAKRERVRHAVVWIVGGVRKGRVVVGPEKDDEFPLKTLVESFDDARELLGVGTLFPGRSGRPTLHLHAAIGRGRAAIAGCPRLGAECWLVDEVVILELVGVDARRALDRKSGLRLLSCRSARGAAG